MPRTDEHTYKWSLCPFYANGFGNVRNYHKYFAMNHNVFKIGYVKYTLRPFVESSEPVKAVLNYNKSRFYQVYALLSYLQMIIHNAYIMQKCLFVCVWNAYVCVNVYFC